MLYFARFTFLNWLKNGFTTHTSFFSNRMHFSTIPQCLSLPGNRAGAVFETVWSCEQRMLSRWWQWPMRCCRAEQQVSLVQLNVVTFSIAWYRGGQIHPSSDLLLNCSPIPISNPALIGRPRPRTWRKTICCSTLQFVPTQRKVDSSAEIVL